MGIKNTQALLNEQLGGQGSIEVFTTTVQTGKDFYAIYTKAFKQKKVSNAFKEHNSLTHLKFCFLLFSRSDVFITQFH